MAYPEFLKIVEVGPRDGLQNEQRKVPLADKIALVDRLAAAGLPAVEAGAFVSPKWVPQMADSAAVLAGIDRRPGVAYPVLVPNLKGLEAALAAEVREIAVFGAASESFSKKNLGRSIAESLEMFAPVIETARDKGLAVRGYVSCVLGCPYEGEIDPGAVAEVARWLRERGCYEISLGDTIGTGNPKSARRLIETVARDIPISELAVHFHDTYGMAIANIHATLEMGIGVADAAVAGLGGCPYAKGATGNVATEDVVYLCQGLGIETGVDLDKLVASGRFVSEVLGRAPASRVNRALSAKMAQGSC
ncbi:MAG: hydroxymethylglutaryl-CoA lyase [Alphaproteobacteria bacterium]|nr:hydroxymethylglutaryl-CoA lyase [Alphaproteobacteria bacterium]